MSKKMKFSSKAMESFLLLQTFTYLGIISYTSASHSEAKLDIVRKTEPIYINEFFTMLITPDLFLPNVSSSSSSAASPQLSFASSSYFYSSFVSSSHNEQFRYRASLLGHPSLPTWMSFRLAKRKNFGYLYGSASESYAGRELDIEIVALNKSSYETSRIIIPIQIMYKSTPLNKIEMKFTNLDWVNMTSMQTVNNLKEIFTEDLWKESENDLSFIFVESATKLGARLPLNPNESEGVIIHIGSNAKLSNRLIELDQEIKPLLKLTTCTFKKTKVQHLFHKFGFEIDWCAFRIVSSEMTQTTSARTLEEREVWNSFARDDLPERNYSEEIAIAVAVPSVIFAFLVALLTIVLCFQHNSLLDNEYERFLKDLFRPCTPAVEIDETRFDDHPKSNEPVQMVQYSGTNKNPPVTALKSVHEPYSDNLSLDSDSPSSNIFLEGSPKLSYYRPNPPAYTGKRPIAKPLFLFQEGPSTSSTVRFKNDI